MNDWYKNPTVLIGAVVVGVVGFILLRNKSSASTSPQLSDLGSTGTTPVGQSNTYIDGSGVQHIITTDPNGGLVGYASTVPQYGATQSQLSTYVGGMSGVPLVNPFVMSGTPYYATYDPSQFLSQLTTYTAPPDTSASNN